MSNQNAFDPIALFNQSGATKTPTIPKDRTNKQAIYCYCRNPECLESSAHERFVFEHKHGGYVECPKCGATEAPYVGVLVLTHYMARLPTGPIRGIGGLGYQVACDPKRAYLATATNQEAATDQPEAVTCPGCLKAMAAAKVDPKSMERNAIKMALEQGIK